MASRRRPSHSPHSPRPCRRQRHAPRTRRPSIARLSSPPRLPSQRAEASAGPSSRRESSWPLTPPNLSLIGRPGMAHGTVMPRPPGSPLADIAGEIPVSFLGSLAVGLPQSPLDPARGRGAGALAWGAVRSLPPACRSFHRAIRRRPSKHLINSKSKPPQNSSTPSRSKW
jgi:hypothetical protein